MFDRFLRKTGADMATKGAVDDPFKGLSGDDAKWLKAELAYDDTYFRMAAQVANWRMFAFISLAIATISVVYIGYIGSKSKFVPVVVEVDKLGQTQAVKYLTEEAAVTDSTRILYRELYDLVINLRTVTTDVAANNAYLNAGFSRLDDGPANYVRNELKKAPPNQVGKDKTVQIKVRSALKLSDNSWQVDWEEHSFSLGGQEIGVEIWRAHVQYAFRPSGKAEDIDVNPSGFTVTQLSWMKVML